MKLKLLFIHLAIGCSLLTACSDNGRDSDNDALPPPEPEPVPEYSFTSVDDRFQRFLDDSEIFDGISYTLVDATQGVVHESALGDHTLDIVVMLASTSKVPAVTLMMAVNDDESLDYDVEASIDNYLPWEGVYGDRTTTQLVSNTSGIPGLTGLPEYGAHLCQYAAVGTLEACGEIIYSTLLPSTQPADEAFNYGGSQWQLAGTVIEQVSNQTWRQAFSDYISDPCELDVFQFGNMWSNQGAWSGNPDSLLGLDNPSIEGGAVSNMQDYAKLLLLHLRDGKCGDKQVLSKSSVEFMQVDRAGKFGTPYGMGWWIIADAAGGAPSVFYDPGAYGAISWIDVERGIGGYVAIDDYTRAAAGDPIGLVLGEIIDLVAAAVDEGRAAIAN